ncbi:DUF4349 domain-containing protein [Rathayibacter sp. VKM Ac-2754]|uniref:DUF4349 domain-containing protein n=1 Tax=Rathayibacter sp. VKM Ac-2754 TaxID=2609251 RepID=UPI00135745D8|nr:DUF4349 domain-containing protein [Rathayibacter sp. VKM Ac-2754]MWV59711.1 DUF4349 domain-containing protein [Rathayibacter sp. VKM Ac-2754]
MTDPITLAPLADERVSALEARVFRSIGASRTARASRRRRTATLGGAAAGLLVLAVVIGPLVGTIGTGSSSSAGSSAADEAPAFAGSGNESNPQTAPDSPESAAGDASTREIVSSASATLEVDSVSDALDALGSTATALGGYVESSTTSALEATTDAMAVDPYVSAPVPEGSGVITIRVPADRLAEARDSLTALGTVTESSISRADVTMQAIDLRARVDSAQASVDRLTELIAQAGSLPDLLAAESALADRQASLESAQQQLTALESQVSLASLTVTAVPESSPTSAQPTGFLDGLLAGWNGLIVAANGALVGIGFLLPWLAVVGVVALIVVAVRRRRGPPATRRPDSAGSGDGDG